MSLEKIHISETLKSINFDVWPYAQLTTSPQLFDVLILGEDYLVLKLFKYSSGVKTGISDSLKSLLFLVINILQSIFIAQ